MKTKDIIIPNAVTIIGGEVEIKKVKMYKLGVTDVDSIDPVLDKDGKPNLDKDGNPKMKKVKAARDGYDVQVTFGYYKDSANYLDSKVIPITSEIKFIWDGKEDFETLAYSLL